MSESLTEFPLNTLRISLIGTGKLGTALARRLHARGLRVYSLFNRSDASCSALAAEIGADRFGREPEEQSDLGELVFLCLPDDVLQEYAQRMARRFGAVRGAKRGSDGGAGHRPADLARRWVHTSGALPASVLQPLSQAGCATASFHPVQTFREGGTPDAFEASYITLQGEQTLCEELSQMATVLGGLPLRVSEHQKTAVHLAAVLVCNYYATLFSGAQQVLSGAGIPVQPRELFATLVRRTVDGLLEKAPQQVLTGPLARGDAGPVQRHLQQLEAHPNWERLYRLLGEQTLKMVRRNASDPAHDRLTRLLRGENETSKASGNDFFERVFEVVARIPAGRVTTYGAIARYLGTGGSARMVGWALNSKADSMQLEHPDCRDGSFTEAGSPATLLPCHRVVNRNGELTGREWFGGDVMQQLLRSEGVAFKADGRVDIAEHFWDPAQDAAVSEALEIAEAAGALEGAEQALDAEAAAVHRAAESDLPGTPSGYHTWKTMCYPVMEHFHTIQGEGAHSGQAAYFIRLAGCDVGCWWCDVKESWDAEKHPEVTAGHLVQAAAESGAPIAVITGGEPLMHDLGALTRGLHEAGMRVHLETSGSSSLSGEIDWITLSPKRFKEPLPEIFMRAHELKVIVLTRKDLAYAEKNAGMCRKDVVRLLQPEWDTPGSVPLIVDYVKEHPQWRISLQTHKFMNVP